MFSFQCVLTYGKNGRCSQERQITVADAGPLVSSLPIHAGHHWG